MSLSEPALVFLLDLGRSLKRRHDRQHASEWVQTLLRYMQKPDPELGLFIAELDGVPCISVDAAPRGEAKQYEQGGLF